MNLRTVMTLGVAALLCATTRVGLAQDFPARPVRFVVPYAQGTALDITARYVADRLARKWGQGVVVENKVGASGIIGTEAALRAPPDGYTLLFTSLSGHVSNATLFTKLPYNPLTDIRPVVQVASSYLVLVVPKSSPVSSIKELSDYMRARPGQLNYGSAGQGNMTHLAAIRLTEAIGAQANNVPYKTHTQALVDTLSGQVFMTFVGVATAAPQVASGAAKALGVTGLKRSSAMPNVPTLAESGIPNAEIVSKLAILAPKGTPDPVVTRVSEAVLEITRSDDFGRFLEQQGLESDTATPEQLAAGIPKEAELWAALIRSSGVQPQ